MKYHKQLNRHDPKNGVWGDCERTALACIMDLEISDVPHFNDNGPGTNEFNKREKAWLATKGYTLFTIPFTCKLENLLESMKIINPNIYYMLWGQSSLGVNHVVIALNDEIIHDPSQIDSGIIEPCQDGYYWIAVLVSHFK